MAREEIDQVVNLLGLHCSMIFVPLSQSRNRDQPSRSLNYRVKVHKGARLIIETDYSMGEGHAPSYARPRTLEVDERMRRECETGRSCVPGKPTTRIFPLSADVIYSLVTEASAIDEACFEDWANSLGYDPDSRKAEAIYRACLETATRLRAAVGEDGLAKLREACADY